MSVIFSAIGTSIGAFTPFFGEEDDIKTLLIERLEACFSQYKTTPAAVADQLWRSGNVDSSPDWSFSNDDQSNGIAQFFSGGSFFYRRRHSFARGE
jgi:hypothetical protein